TQPKGTGSFKKRGDRLHGETVLSIVAIRNMFLLPGLLSEVIALFRQQSSQAKIQSLPQPAHADRSTTLLNLYRSTPNSPASETHRSGAASQIGVITSTLSRSKHAVKFAPHCAE